MPAPAPEVGVDMNATSKPSQLMSREIVMDLGNVRLEGRLTLPQGASGIVLFVHGSGSSRHSPRNRFFAEVLHSAGIATLLLDLLTREEEILDWKTGRLRFDIPLLTKRLIAATAWTLRQPDTSKLRIGYFGASTGAAAALAAAACLRESVAAVVCRGGGPTLAESSLSFVRAPTLLIVGGEDTTVLGLNRQALAKLCCSDKELVVIPGASHLFQEPGSLEEAARMAASWFEHHLAVANSAGQGAPMVLEPTLTKGFSLSPPNLT